jgi:uncharacterized protein (TIGR00369 family)
MDNAMGTNPFWNHIQIEEIFSNCGEATVKCNVFESLFNFSGVVHGGVLATLIDASIGSAVRSTLDSNQRSATVDLNIKYIKPAKSATLAAKSTISHRGKTLAVGISEVFDDTNTLVAMGTATFIIMDK